MLSIFDIAGSALNAQSQRMNVSASNLANATSSTGSVDVQLALAVKTARSRVRELSSTVPYAHSLWLAR